MSQNAVISNELGVSQQPNTHSSPLYLQLANMYAPAWGYGGPVRLMFDYARWMSQQFEVEVFTGDVNHDFERISVKSETISGVRVSRHKVLSLTLARKSIYLLSPSLCLQVGLRIWSSDKPAIVHFSEFRGIVPLYAMLLKAIFGARVTLVHSAFGSLHYKRSNLRKIYDAFLLKSFVKLVSLRIVQNEHERETYRKICERHEAIGQRQITLLPLHTDLALCNTRHFVESGKHRSAQREIRRAYNIPEAALVFVFLGRLHPAKGILRMINAFAEFSRSCSQETLLLIVGRDDGFQADVEGYLSKLGLQKNARIVNNVYDERFDYYFLADVFLGFPTIFEETMLSSIEALACGTPILVSREADIPYVEEEGAGRVIDFDVRTAANAMASMTQNLSSYQDNARRVVEKHFSGTATARKLMALFQMAISRSAIPRDLEDTGCIEASGTPKDTSMGQAPEAAYSD
jgi:glycosyltransferase involved in cell wall biosynthesis